jgi:hypothetical protein
MLCGINSKRQETIRNVLGEKTIAFTTVADFYSLGWLLRGIEDQV